MPYGLNAVSQTSDLYKNKQAISSWGYQPSAGSSTFGFKSSFSANKDYTFGYKPTDYSSIAEQIKKGNRSTLDRIFDTLSVFNYTMMGAAVNVLDDREDTTALGGIWSGLKAANPFGQGFQEGEKTGADLLNEFGWKPNPNDTVGGIARFGAGLALDILTDPTTYMTFGVSGLIKGTQAMSKVGKVAVEGAEQLIKRRVSADDVMTILKDVPDLGKELTPELAEELATRTNKYAGMTFDKNRGAVAFDFFSNKKWGFRKEFISAEAMSELGDKLGTAKYTQNALDSIVSHPYYSKLGKSATRHALARKGASGLEDLVKEIRAEDLYKGQTRNIMKANSEIRELYEHNKDQFSESQFIEITNALEISDQFLKRKTYNSLTDVEEVQNILESLKNAKASYTNAVSGMTEKYALYLSTKEELGKKLTDTERYIKKAYSDSYSAKNKRELIEVLRKKYSDIDEVALQQQDVLSRKEEVDKLIKAGIDESKASESVRVKEIASKIEELSSKTDQDIMEGYIAKRLGQINGKGNIDALMNDSETLAEFDNFLKMEYGQSVDRVSMIKQFEDDIKNINMSYNISKSEAMTKQMAEDIKKRFTSSGFIRYEGDIDEVSGEILDMSSRSKKQLHLPSTLKAGKIGGVADSTIVFERNGIVEREYSVLEYTSAESLFDLAKTGKVKEEAMETVSIILEDVMKKDVKTRREAFKAVIEKYAPFYSPVFDNVKIRPNILKSKSDVEALMKVIFNTTPKSAEMRMMQFAENSAGVSRIMKRNKWERLEWKEGMDIDALKNKITSMWKGTPISPKYMHMTSTQELVKFSNRQYIMKTKQLLEDDNYFRQEIDKLRQIDGKEEFDTIMKAKFDGNIRKMLKATIDSSAVEGAMRSQNYTHNVIQTLLYAPDNILEKLSAPEFTKEFTDRGRRLIVQKDEMNKTLSAINSALSVEKDADNIKKLMLHKETLEKKVGSINGKIDIIKSKLSDTIAGSKVRYDSLYRAYLYEFEMEKYKRQLQNRFALDKKDMFETDEVKGYSMAPAGDDPYFDYSNTLDYQRAFAGQTELETRGMTDVRHMDAVQEYIDGVKDAMDRAIYDVNVGEAKSLKEFKSTKYYVERKLNGEYADKYRKANAKKINPISIISKELGVSDDVAYDMYKVLNDVDFHDVYEPAKVDTLITDEEFVITAMIDALPNKRISELTQDDYDMIDSLLMKAKERGGERLISMKQYHEEAKALDKVISYISAVKDTYKKYGLDDLFPEINDNIKDFNILSEKIETGSYIFEDMKKFGYKLDEGMALDYTLSTLKSTDFKMHKSWTNDIRRRSEALHDSILSSAKAHHSLLLNRLEEASKFKQQITPNKELIAKRKELLQKQFILEKRMNNIVNAIGNGDVAKLRVEDMLMLKHTMDLGRINTLLPALGSKFGVDYTQELLKGYSNLSDFISNKELKRAIKNEESAKNRILKHEDARKEIKSVINDVLGQYKGVVNLAMKMDGLKNNVFKYEGGEHIEYMNIRVKQIEELINTVETSGTYDDVAFEPIMQFLGVEFDKYGGSADEIRDVIARRMEEEFVDKKTFKPDTILNAHQQRLTLEIAEVLDGIKDAEDLNVFIKNYIPHMIKDKYIYLFAKEDMVSNPVSKLIGGGIEKFNKHSLSRRWNYTIQEFKDIVIMAKESITNHKSPNRTSEAYKHMMASSYQHIFKEIKKNGGVVLKGTTHNNIPYTYTVNYDAVDGKFFVNINDAIFGDGGTPEDYRGFAESIASRIQKGVDSLDGVSPENEEFYSLSMAQLVKHYSSSVVDGKYDLINITNDFKDGKIPAVDFTESNALQYYNEMPVDLFEDNPLKLVLTRKLYSNKIVADEDSFKQIKSLICNDVKRLTDEKLDDIPSDHSYVIPFREMKDILEDVKQMPQRTAREKNNRDVALRTLEKIIDADEGRNTFLAMNKVQADFFYRIIDKDLKHIKSVRSELLKTYNEVEKKQLSQGMEAFLSYYDKLLAWWKVNVTVVSPAFHVANKTGNAFNSFLDVGFKVLDGKFRREVKHILQGKMGEIITDDGRAISYREILSNAADFGIFSEGAFGRDLRESMEKAEIMDNSKIIEFISKTEFAKKNNITKDKMADWQKWNPLDTNSFIVYQKGTEIGAIQDNMDRMVHYVANLQKGLSPADAYEHTQKFLFDYSKGTPFEKEVIKRVFPFWSFLRNNTKLQLQMLAEKPHIYRTVAKIRNEFEGQVPYSERLDKSKIAHYAADWWQTPFDRETRSGSTDLLFNPNLPFQGFNSLNMENIFSSINPILKAPVELGTGKSIYSGKQIYSSAFDYFATQTFAGGTINKLNSSGVDGKIIKLASALLGIKVGQYNEDKQNLLYHDSMLSNIIDEKNDREKGVKK